MAGPRRRLFSIAALLCGAAVLVGAAAGQARPVSSPGTFPDDFEATLASGAGKLFLANTGKSAHGPMRIRVLEFRAGSWRRLGGSPETAGGYPIGLVVAPRSGVPCVSDVTRGGRARIRCFARGKWRPRWIAPHFRGMSVTDLATRGPHILALFSRWAGQGAATVSEARLGVIRRGRVVPLGRKLARKGQFWFGLVNRTRGPGAMPIEVGLKSAMAGRYQVFSLNKRIWRPGQPLALPWWGSWGSAPVRSGGSLYVVANQDMFGAEWKGTTSVYRRAGTRWSEVGGGPVSKGTGYAQGGVYAVGQRVWVIWQENDSSRGLGEMMPTRVFAARISADGRRYDREIELWQGEVYFPVQTRATGFRGAPVFLYGRQFRPEGGIHNSVDLGWRR